MTNKEIKNKLEMGNVQFTVNGLTDYKKELMRYEIRDEYVNELSLRFGGGYNIRKFTKNQLHLYSFCIFGNPLNFRIKYEDINILNK